MKERFINAITKKKHLSAEEIQKIEDEKRRKEITEGQEKKTKDTETVKRIIHRRGDESDHIENPEAWAKIMSTQEQKEAVVEALKHWRPNVSTSGEVIGKERITERQNALFEKLKDARTLRSVGARQYETTMEDGALVSLTEGEVFAAAEWGCWWQFDPSVPRVMQNKLMLHQVHTVLADQFDQQLMTFGRADRLSDDRKRDAYARKQDEEKSLEKMPDGILVEKMLMSFLTKEMHDHAKDLPFTVKSVDVYEDIEHKIDFVITVEGMRRGVKAKAMQRIGIQFTTSKSKETKEKKEKQLDRMRAHLNETEVDQLVLIAMPVDDIRPNFDRWRYTKDGKRVSEKKLDPRGPDHFWSPETKKKIIDGLVRGIGLE